MATPQEMSLADLVGLRVAQHLRALQGTIPVRGRAHLEPPIGAVPIQWVYHYTLAGAGALLPQSYTAQVHWQPISGSNGGELTTDHPHQQFPQGFAGVVWASCVASQDTTVAALNLPRQAQWTLTHNGAAVPGFLRQHPGGYQTMQASNNTIPLSGRAWQVETACPILLYPTSRMAFTFHLDDQPATTNVGFVAQLRGWMFPFPDDGNPWIQS